MCVRAFMCGMHDRAVKKAKEKEKEKEIAREARQNAGNINEKQSTHHHQQRDLKELKCSFALFCTF